MSISSSVFNSIFNTKSTPDEFNSLATCFSSSDLNQYLSRIDSDLSSQNNARIHCIEYLIEKINKCKYGAGEHYELYKERKQDDLEYLISNLSLSSSELKHFKDQTYYDDNFNPYVTECEMCECEVSPYEDAKSTQMETKSLCSLCLDSLYS